MEPTVCLAATREETSVSLCGRKLKKNAYHWFWAWQYQDDQFKHVFGEDSPTKANLCTTCRDLYSVWLLGQ